MTLLRIYYIIIGILIFSTTASAQNDPDSIRYTEEEIRLQGQLLEAQGERLIGNFEEAEKKLLVLKDRWPEESAVFFELALVSDEIEKPAEALEYIATAIELDPGNPWYYHTQAEIAEKSERFDLATASWGKLIDLHPERSNYYISLAYALLKDGQAEKSLEILNELEGRIGITEEVSKKKHLIQDAQGNYEQAVAEIRKLIETYPGEMEYRHLLVNYYDKIGQRGKAIAVLEEIVQVDPDDSSARLRLARARQQSGEMDGAYLTAIRPMLMDKTISLDQKIRELIPWVEKFASERDSSLGLELLEISGELRTVHQTDNAKINSLEGDIYYNLGQKEKAVNHYIKALEYNDRIYSVWEQLMFALDELELYNELLDYSTRAGELFPNEASAIYLQAKAFHKKERDQTALSLLQQAEIIAGREAWLKQRIYELKGDVQSSLGDGPAALDSWEQSIKWGNPSERIRNKIEHSKAN